VRRVLLGACLRNRSRRLPRGGGPSAALLLAQILGVLGARRALQLAHRRIGMLGSDYRVTLLAAALAGAALGVRAEGEVASADVDRLARTSVDARFVPDPADDRRDMVTGQRRDQLEQSARDYYGELLLRDPAQFDRARRRLLGSASAEDLQALALSELEEGRPASAELAWERLVSEHPEAPEAAPALMKLASSRLAAGERTSAATELARLPELDVEMSYQAAPLMARLLDDIEQDLARRETPPSGKDRVVLHQSLQSRDLERVRELSEWTAGYALLDEVARPLRIETSGDVMRVVKKAGQDDVRLDTLVGLIPLEERVASVRTEERLRDPGDVAAADARATERGKGKALERFENLSRLQQLQVLLLARTLEDLEIEPDALRLGDATLVARRDLSARIEDLAASAAGRPPKKGATPASDEDLAVGRLARLSDWNDDGKLTPLFDDEGMWKSNRFAVEGDMRNAIFKPLDDDNKRRIADLFEQTGMTEQALFASLVRATTKDDRVTGPRVSPELADRLLATLEERGRPVYEAAPHSLKQRPGDIEREYLARLSVLRLPGEALDDVLRRELLEPASSVGSGALASDGRAGRLVAELASLGRRYEGAWLFEDDPPTQPDARTATQKLGRAEEIRGELDDISAGMALDEITRVLVADLESQGMRFSQRDVADVRQTIQHEDLGTLALVFDELGDFSHVDKAIAMSQPGTALGSRGPGHFAYGFGLDILEGTPGAGAGWRNEKNLKDGDTTLSYHVGGGAGPEGVADASGVSARFRRKRVWQPEVGADASIIRGLAGRGFFNLIRDVNRKHEKKLAQIFEDHEAARKEGRTAFVSSVTAEKAPARPAVLFANSVGHSNEAMDRDDASFRVLSDSYEFEKARQKSMLNRKAHVVRFAGVGFSAAFFSGQVYLLAGPKIAVKDFRLFSRLVDSPSLRVQSEEAELRRSAVATWPRGGTLRRQQTEVALDRAPDSGGMERFAPRLLDERTEIVQLPAGHERPVAAPRPTGPGGGTPPAEAVALVASTKPVRVGGKGDATTTTAAPPVSDPTVERLSRALRSRGVPLRIEGTAGPHDFVFVPAGLAPWCAQSIDIFVFEQQGLGLRLAENGSPVLVAPTGLDGVIVDAMQERRSVTRPGEADEAWRVSFSLSPGAAAASVIEASARRVRCEIVDGKLIGGAVISTKHRLPDGAPRQQSNLLAPSDPDVEMRIASLRGAAEARVPAALPTPPAVALRPASPPSDGTISDPADLSEAFVASLRGARAQDLATFKTRNINHAALRASSGERVGTLDPENVEYIQALSLEAHGRLLSGAALEHAHFLLTHEALYYGDGGTVAKQVALIEQRAVLPMRPGHAMSEAADPATRRLIEKAGIDEPAALTALSQRMGESAQVARESGKLERTTLPAGTRIVTSSWSGPVHGVQWTTATSGVEAHVIEPLSLSSNEGRYVMAMGLGPDLPALRDAVSAELGTDVSEPELEDAVARALASPSDERTLAVAVAGTTVELALAEAPRAGALARCKNAALFPPAYGAKVARHHEQALVATPVMYMGGAEAAARFVGQAWAGWRILSLLAGGPTLGEDHDDHERETPPEPEPPGEGREGGGPGLRSSGRDRPGDRPQSPPPEVEPPRESEPPGGRGGTRGTPGDRPPPPPVEELPPRVGQPPPDRIVDRPVPPDPSDRPRRPVD